MSGGQVDGRAVLPQPLELVVGTLLLVLDMHDEIPEVDKNPASVALALAPHRLDAECAKLVFHAVDDRTDLTVVGCGRQNEDVGERELLTDVYGDDLAGQLVLGGCRDSLGEINGTLRGGHAVLLLVVLFSLSALFSGIRVIGSGRGRWVSACAPAPQPDQAGRADAWRCTARRRRAPGTSLVRPPGPGHGSRWS